MEHSDQLVSGRLYYSRLMHASCMRAGLLMSALLRVLLLTMTLPEAPTGVACASQLPVLSGRSLQLSVRWEWRKKPLRGTQSPQQWRPASHGAHMSPAEAALKLPGQVQRHVLGPRTKMVGVWVCGCVGAVGLISGWASQRGCPATQPAVSISGVGSYRLPAAHEGRL
jgi:hypothetical protein